MTMAPLNEQESDAPYTGKRTVTVGEWTAEWDDDTRTLRRWQAAQLIEQRPYSDSEITALVAADDQRNRSGEHSALLDVAMAAIAANDAEIAESQAVAARAQELATNPVQDLPTGQIVAVLKELATGIGVLAAHDLTAKQELSELIRLVVPHVAAIVPDTTNTTEDR